MIDGNGLAGLLTQLLGDEATMLERRCQGCGNEHALGAHRAYPGPAHVLRCPGCGALALRILERDDALLVEWSGVLRIPVK